MPFGLCKGILAAGEVFPCTSEDIQSLLLEMYGKYRISSAASCACYVLCVGEHVLGKQVFHSILPQGWSGVHGRPGAS